MCLLARCGRIHSGSAVLPGQSDVSKFMSYTDYRLVATLGNNVYIVHEPVEILRADRLERHILYLPLAERFVPGPVSFLPEFFHARKIMAFQDGFTQRVVYGRFHPGDIAFGGIKIRFHGKLVLAGIEELLVRLLLAGKYGHVRALLVLLELRNDDQVRKLLVLHELRKAFGMITTGNESRHFRAFGPHVAHGIGYHGLVPGLGHMVELERFVYTGKHLGYVVASRRYLVLFGNILYERGELCRIISGTVRVDVRAITVGKLHAVKLFKKTGHLGHLVKPALIIVTVELPAQVAFESFYFMVHPENIDSLVKRNVFGKSNKVLVPLGLDALFFGKGREITVESPLRDLVLFEINGLENKRFKLILVHPPAEGIDKVAPFLVGLHEIYPVLQFDRIKQLPELCVLRGIHLETFRELVYLLPVIGEA